MARVHHNHHVPFVSQGNDDTACWVACLAMLMHFKQGQSARLRPSTELCSMFREHLKSKGYEISGRIKPVNVPWMAQLMGLKLKRLNEHDTLQKLKSSIADSPVAIFGSYHDSPGATNMHATVAFKLQGDTDRPSNLYISGYDPQSAEPGKPYKHDFSNFHDPSMPHFSILKRGDFLVYC